MRILILVAVLLSSAYARAVCGDGALDGGEGCDDGNGREGDGCSSSCAIEPVSACDELDAISLSNPGFEAGAPSANGAWKVLTGNVDWVQGSAFGGCMPAGEEDYSIDLNGSTQGVIAQSLTTVVGEKYGVIFLGNANCVTASGVPCSSTCSRVLTVGVADDTEAADADDVTAPLSTVLFTVHGGPQTVPWQTMRFEFTAQTTQTLLFFSGSDTALAGPMVDDVRIPVSSCRPSSCGDGVLDEGEACDDGNTAGGDGCTSDCAHLETGYDCGTPGQPCAPPCGDGVKQNTESCDDGPASDGDGCSATCEIEANWTCEVVPPATSSTCACIAGYSLDGGACVDVDECTAGTDTCDTNADCTNIPGSFTCACQDGFTGDGSTCTDIDECSTGADDCDASASCENTSGSFTCTCNEGFTGDGTTCTDVDECAAGTDDCGDNADCTNTSGAFTCACQEGFTGDGATCTDVDECTAGTDDCADNADCANTPGSFTCTCQEGYSGDGQTCESLCGNGDIDAPEACDDANARPGDGCSATCMVEDGWVCDTLTPVAVGDPGAEDHRPGVGESPWRVMLGNVDWVDGAAFGGCMPAGDGMFSVDLNGNEQGVIGQTIDTVADQKYGILLLANANCVTGAGVSCETTCSRTLTLGVADDAAGTAGLGDLYEVTQYTVNGSPKATPWQTLRFDFTARSAKTLIAFSGKDEAQVAGPMVDDARIPASWCRPLSCGDGKLDDGETCDDGNTDGTDGCSSDCQTVQTGYACETAGELCVCEPDRVKAEGLDLCLTAEEVVDAQGCTDTGGCGGPAAGAGGGLGMLMYGLALLLTTRRRRSPQQDGGRGR